MYAEKTAPAQRGERGGATDLKTVVARAKYSLFQLIKELPPTNSIPLAQVDAFYLRQFGVSLTDDFRAIEPNAHLSELRKHAKLLQPTENPSGNWHFHLLTKYRKKEPSGDSPKEKGIAETGVVHKIEHSAGGETDQERSAEAKAFSDSVKQCVDHLSIKNPEIKAVTFAQLESAYQEKYNAPLKQDFDAFQSSAPLLDLYKYSNVLCSGQVIDGNVTFKLPISYLKKASTLIPEVFNARIVQILQELGGTGSAIDVDREYNNRFRPSRCTNDRKNVGQKGWQNPPPGTYLFEKGERGPGVLKLAPEVMQTVEKAQEPSESISKGFSGGSQGGEGTVEEGAGQQIKPVDGVQSMEEFLFGEKAVKKTLVDRKGDPVVVDLEEESALAPAEDSNPPLSNKWKRPSATAMDSEVPEKRDRPL